MDRAEKSPKIFLAHASEDKPQVRELYADLAARGLDPWLDETDLVAGQIWKQEIPKAIREAKVFLACLSSRSVGKVGYVHQELRVALSAFGERPPGSIYIIPVRLDDCDVPDLQTPDRGLSLKDIHRVDLWQEGGLDRLVIAITRAQASRKEAPTVVTPSEQVAERRAAGTPKRVLPETQQEQEVIAEPVRPRGSLRWHHPTVVASIIGAIAVVVAAFLTSPILDRFLGDRDQKGKEKTAVPPRVVTTPDQLAGLAPSAGPLELGVEIRDCDGCPLMMVVPEGSFAMGSTQAERTWALGQEKGVERERADWERPRHVVKITEPFAMSKYEVTFDEWDVCVADGGCNSYLPDDENWGRGRRPVINVSWEDAQAYVAWLSQETGHPYRLLTEAEWEYAARAGTTTRYSWGDDITPENANYRKSGVGKTTEVGSYPPNTWGLHDIHGNVWEWVEDCLNEGYEGAPGDGSAWTSGACTARMMRGGSWDDEPGILRSGYRGGYSFDGRRDVTGFRVAMTLSRIDSVSP